MGLHRNKENQGDETWNVAGGNEKKKALKHMFLDKTFDSVSDVLHGHTHFYLKHPSVSIPLES